MGLTGLVCDPRAHRERIIAWPIPREFPTI
jgi:hypothetical protein